MTSKVDYDKVQARLGPELFELFEAFRNSNGFDKSAALRVLIARGLYRSDGGDPGEVDEVAFMAAYHNARQALVGEMRKVLTGTPIRDMMRRVSSAVGSSLGVRYT